MNFLLFSIKSQQKTESHNICLMEKFNKKKLEIYFNVKIYFNEASIYFRYIKKYITHSKICSSL